MVRTEVNVNKAAKTITITQGTPSRQLDADALFEAVIKAYSNNDFTTLTMDYIEQQPEQVDLLAIYDQFCYEPTNAEYDEASGKVTESSVGLGFDFEAENEKLQALAPGETYVIQMEQIQPRSAPRTSPRPSSRTSCPSLAASMSGIPPGPPT